MMLWLLISTALSVVQFCSMDNICDGIEAKSFDFRDILGSWYVVGVTTSAGNKLEANANPCFLVEFTEADESGLKQFIKSQTNLKYENDVFKVFKGTRLHQRFVDFELPYDPWSKALEGAKGCFEEVVSIYSGDDYIYSQTPDGSMRDIMQFHLVSSKLDQGQYMIQLNWGTLISDVIYRRTPDKVARQELAPTLDLLSQLRRNRTLTHLCDTTPNVARN